MRHAFACFALQATATVGVKGQTIPPHSNGTGHPYSYWIVSTSESRRPKESLYLTTSSRGEGALRGWTHQDDIESKFHLMPVNGSADTFDLVATSESRKAGYYTYLDNAGKGEAWPWDPEVPDPKGQWRIVPSDPFVSKDGPAYFIVSTADSREPNEVLFYNEFGSVDSWGFTGRDDKCLWMFILAPPSPPLGDAKERMEAHNRITPMGYVGFILFACCVCGSCCRNKERRRRTRERGRHVVRQVSSGNLRLAFTLPPVAEARPVTDTSTNDTSIPVVQGVPVAHPPV
jgi:hypothetical protein